MFRFLHLKLEIIINYNCLISTVEFRNLQHYNNKHRRTIEVNAVVQFLLMFPQNRTSNDMFPLFRGGGGVYLSA